MKNKPWKEYKVNITLPKKVIAYIISPPNIIVHSAFLICDISLLASSSLSTLLIISLLFFSSFSFSFIEIIYINISSLIYFKFQDY